MKYLLSISTICLILSISLISMGQTSEQLFNKLKEKYNSNFPKDFVAKVSGNEISNSLKKVPEDSYCKKKKPVVTYLFLKNVDESLIVENVENPYVTRFQAHLEIYKSAKSFLTSKKSFNEMKRIYFWKKMKSNDSNFYLIKMRKHRIRESDFYYLYVNKSDLTLKKVEQFSNNVVVGTINIEFKKIDRYFLPSSLSFDVLKKGKKKKFKLIISDYRLNIGLTSNKILELQDDCPKINS